MKIIYAVSCLLVISCANPFKKKPTGSDLFTYSITPNPPDTATILARTAINSEYRGTRTKLWDLLHTKLSIAFDYHQKEVSGTARLRLKPWFYPQDSLTLDAKHMGISTVNSLKPGLISRWTSDTSHIYIKFLKPISDTIDIEIIYTARPEEGVSHGSEAIKDNKGLYFINADSSDTFKPTEIWTQGETESASGWFPTIDAPNEKMTQEIALTVDSGLQTLSNGRLVKTIYTANGKKTDFWEQKKPHSPYLAMVAVGPWKIYKDKWRDSVEVNYYMEKEYAPYARLIFGNTPEMLEHFSKRLGVVYPWDKYSQVVVRDFVSGAMENTTAVVHGEFLNHDHREHLDNTYEDVISHELFHHWFGDLVTCESWSNLPLNESFATYGEYMWREYKYGKDDAEYHRLGFIQRYLAESESKQEPLIRYHYADKEDMFDAHSYQKGGALLYSLRKMVGDGAFYKSLELYLKRHSFKNTEINDLRIAFEEITGNDLQLFFNEFFMTAGHPEFSLESTFKKETNELVLTVTQTGNHSYHIPLEVEVMAGGSKQLLHLNITPEQEEYVIPVAGPVTYINPDPDKNWLIVWRRTQDAAAWHQQFLNSKSFMGQYEALDAIRIYFNADQENKTEALALLKEALGSDKKGIVLSALDFLEGVEETTTIEQHFIPVLIALAEHQDATVRHKTLNILNKLSNPSLLPIYQKAIYDSSYRVLGTALTGMMAYDNNRAVQVAETYIKSSNKKLQLAALPIISEYGKLGLADIYRDLLKQFPINGRITIISYMGSFLSKTTDSSEAARCLETLVSESMVKQAPWYYSYFIRGAMEFAEKTQPNPAVTALIRGAMEKLPPGGSILLEKN